MDARKKLDAKIENTTENVADQQPDFIEGWPGQLPTESWDRLPDKLLVHADEDDEKNVEWHYNPSRGQYFYEVEPDPKKPYKKSKHPDYSKPVVDLYDSSDEEDTSDTQTKKSKDSHTVSAVQSSMFSLSAKASTVDQSSKNPKENSSNLKRKRS